MYQIKIENSK